MINKNDIENLMQDTEFMAKLENAQSAEELTALMQDKGYEVDPDNARLALAYKNGECELPEELLDEVAGGHPGVLLVGMGVLLLIVGTATFCALAKEVSSWSKKKK